MADEKSPMRISHRLLAINRSEMRIGMENIVSKLIMYGDMPADSILMKLCDVSKRAKDMDAPKDELVIEAYRQIKRLLVLATSYGFDNNLWHNYLTFLLITDENPFSITCEKVGAKDGSANIFAKNDFKAFYELFHYDFSWLQERLGIDSFDILENYKAIGKPELMYNKNVSEKVRGLSLKLGQAEDADEIFELVTGFYKAYGVGMFGLNKAFRFSSDAEGLILIYNSLRGIYTHASHLDDLVINALKKLDIDILLAVCVDEDYVYGILSAVKDFEAVNFDYGENLFTFCRKFDYDWKRDLPDIAKCIGYKYDKYVPLTYYSQWFEAGVMCNKKILASAAVYDREFFSRRLAIMLIDFMKDDSVKLSKVNSIKNPDLRLILDELPSVADDVKRTYFLVIDVDETIRSASEIVEKCVFGGWINKEYVELFDTINALQLFKALIPDILRREMILCG